MNIQDELARLAKVVDRLESEQAILAVIIASAQAIDYGDEDAWAACFTDDAVHEIRYSGEPDAIPHRGGDADDGVVRFVGAEQMRKLAEAHTRAPDAYHKHHALNPRIVLSGDAATSESYILRLDIDLEGLPYIRSFGRYLDEFRRDVDGQWRMSRRIAEVEAFDPRPFRRAGGGQRS